MRPPLPHMEDPRSGEGRINVGPRKTRTRDGEPLDVKILPRRLDADVVARQGHQEPHGAERRVRYGNYVPDDSSLQSCVLARHRMGIIMPKGHRLANKPTLRVNDLVNEPILMDPRSANPRLYDDIIASVRARGVNLNVTSEIPNGEVLLLLVASGHGLAFGTGYAARVFSFVGSQWKPVSDLGLEVRELVMWRPDDAEAPLLRPFLDVVRDLRTELHGPGVGRAEDRGRRSRRPRHHS